MPSRETLDAFTSKEFLAGFAFGLIALALGALVVYVWHQWRNTPAPIVGVLLTVTAIAALQTTRDLSSNLWVGIILLTLGGALYPWATRVPLLPVALAIPGAWWVTRIVELSGVAWVSWLLFAWIVVGAPLVTSFDRHFVDRGYGPILLVISIAGMFTTLPDTEEILVLFGVALPLALLAWPKVAGSLGAVGVYPAFGLLAWVITTGGRGRESAVVGATASLALLVLEPLIRWWRSRTFLDRIPNKWWWVPMTAGLQLVIVLLATRVAGLIDASQRAAITAGLVLFGATAVLAIVGHRAPVWRSKRRATRNKTIGQSWKHM